MNTEFAAARLDKPDNYKWLLLGVVMIGTLMGALDSSIVNVSIPAIMADFGVSVDDIEWVITSYMLAFATLMPLTAWLRDRVGHKKLYIGSLVIFTVGSVLCGVAWNLPSLIVARVIQALGGGAITPTAMAMISETFDKSERGKAIGYWGVGVIVGPAVGPTLGGILTKAFGWRSIFLVNLPIGIVGLILAIFILREDAPHRLVRRAFDTWGFLFLSTFLIAFLYGLSQGESKGWDSSLIVGCALLSVFAFVGFLLVEGLVPNGIVDIKLFRSPIFSICILLTFVRSVALYGGTFLLPLFMQRHMGLDEIDSGLILLPGALIIGVVMPIAGRLSDKMGPRSPTLVGLLGLFAFMFMYRNLDPNTSVWQVIEPTLIRGVGLGLLMAPLTAAAMNAVPMESAGMASSILNIMQQVGGSVGIGVLGTVLSHRTHFHLDVIGSSMHTGTPAFQAAITRMTEHALKVGYSPADAAVVGKTLVVSHLANMGSVQAFQDSFLVGAGIALAALVPALFLPKQIEHSVDQELAMME